MRKICLFFFAVTGALNVSAQLTVTPNQTASYLANKLVATSGTLGVIVNNAVLTCDTNSNGEFTGVSNLGISDGIVLGSGDVATNTLAYGIDGLPSDFSSSYVGTPGDTQLDLVVGTTTYDACVLEFDLQPVGNFVEFEYVFGSEEYPEFNCSAFNDVFGFFISGPGFSSPTNIALIPGTSTEVSINSINDGTMSAGTCTANTLLYVNNTGTTSTMDGFTTPLIAQASVTPGATYHLKMAIADASDAIFNSFVVLKANSLKSGSQTPSSVSHQSASSGLDIYPTQVLDKITLNNIGSKSWKLAIMNMNGQCLKTISLNSGQSSVSWQIGDLPSGFYMVRAEDQQGSVHIYRLVKE